MTQRVPTAWDGNTLKNDGVGYSSASITYNSATTAFSSLTVDLADSGKLPSVWTPSTKVGTIWNPNPAAITSLYAYDSSTMAYDSTTDSYDGVVSGEDFADQKTATSWSSL